MSDKTQNHAAFRHISSTPVDSLNIVIDHYEHIKTGAVHYHICSDHDEKAFLVALRTMPHDSTGVAHILEHTALCGSEKYQVRDPFFMMTRRSLNTFMNAMTSSDWTAYPFASQNDKDFNNLLDVYLDAVFFARLDELDFAQEGHRVEFEDATNQDSELVYKGVVFNEMKGAMSSAVSQLWQGISSVLFPTTTYHYNSGGEPENIVDLSYAELKEFYTTHYHPTNAIFMTFGNLDVVDLQGKMNDQALERFERQEKQWRVDPEKRFSEPQVAEASYGVDSDDLSGKTHHVIGWLLGDSIDLDAQLEANLVSQVLLDNSASPLRRALEETDLGTSPSPMCGLEDSNREMSFMCGIEGSEPEHAEAIEKIVLDTLKSVARDGVEQSHIDAAVHQLELHQREIGGDSYPYGLQLILNSLPAATHYGDPVALLNLDPALVRLKERAAKGDFMQQAVKRLLLDNPHRVRYTLKPDAELNAEKVATEKARLADMRAAMSPEDLEAVKQKAIALEERQAAEDDPELLPKVTLADVAPELAYVAPTNVTNNESKGLPVAEYITGTNGIVYQQLLADLPPMTPEQLTWLPFFTQTWTEIGAGGHDYLTQQQRQTATVGSLSSYASVKSNVNDCNAMTGYLVMSGKALGSNAEEFSSIIKETWQAADFTEEKRLKDLLGQARARKEQGITGGGHSLAMSLASAPLNPAAHFMNELGGLPQAKRLKARTEQVKAEGASCLVKAMQDIYAIIDKTPDSALMVHDDVYGKAHMASLSSRWDHAGKQQSGNIVWTPDTAPTYWMVDSQVNFCAWALPTVTLTHADSAALAVLGGILRNGHLHTAIREKGGAYGAGATQDSSMAVFKFYTYRDPRVEGSFNDFEASIDWVLNMKSGDDLVEQAVLGIIGSLDRPGSPAGEAKQAFHMDKGGRTQAIRQQFRDRLLAVNWADVQRVADTYLRGQQGSRAVVAPRGTESMGEKLGLIVQDY
jgi:Zn-dependent M16 (insulinase) family peptidase